MVLICSFPLFFTQDVLKTLMSYAKDLGNNMFRRKLFPYAHELYLLGTIIAHDLRVRSIMNVDVEFVSVLYANLAFSKIKLVSMIFTLLLSINLLP